MRTPKRKHVLKRVLNMFQKYQIRDCFSDINNSLKFIFEILRSLNYE